MPGLRGYFSFQGRASRKEFWVQSFAAMLLFGVVGFFVMALMMVAHALMTVIAGHDDPTIDNAVGFGGIPFLLADFGVYGWVLIAVATRRRHDLDKPFGFEFFNGGGFRIWMSRGTIGPNKHGPDPLDRKPQ